MIVRVAAHGRSDMFELRSPPVAFGNKERCHASKPGGEHRPAGRHRARDHLTVFGGADDLGLEPAVDRLSDEVGVAQSDSS
jgi:hypothetical protein